MLNSAASALVNIDPAGTTRDETIGRNLASEYSNIHGKSESVREQLQSLNMVNREDMNDKSIFVFYITTNLKSHVELSGISSC